MKQQYRVRQGQHNIEKEIAPLIERDFPEYENFIDRHLITLTKNGHWRNDTLEYLELIGMACFAVLKSINFINRNIEFMKRGDPDQRFKNIYFHFGLIADSVENLSRNIALTSDYLGIDSIHKDPKDYKDLIESFEKWVEKTYNKEYGNLLKGKPLSFFPHSIDFLSLTISKKTRKNYNAFITSIKKYRNFYTHNPGVDIIQWGQDKIYVVKRQNIIEARSWSNLKAMIEASLEMFVNPKEQVREDLKELLKHLRVLWDEFDIKMNQIKQHENYGQIIHGFKRKAE